MSKFLKGTTLTSRRNYYLMLAASWLYSFGPPVAGVVGVPDDGYVEGEDQPDPVE